MNNDLVVLIENLIESKLKVGKDVGVISYNENTFKEDYFKWHRQHLTNFAAMGEETAKIIKENSPRHVEVPFSTKTKVLTINLLQAITCIFDGYFL